MRVYDAGPVLFVEGSSVKGPAVKDEVVDMFRFKQLGDVLLHRETVQPDFRLNVPGHDRRVPDLRRADQPPPSHHQSVLCRQGI